MLPKCVGICCHTGSLSLAECFCCMAGSHRRPADNCGTASVHWHYGHASTSNGCAN